MIKKEVGLLVVVGVIERANNSELGGVSLAQPTPKSNQVRFLSNVRNINKQLKRKSYPMPNINNMSLKLGGFCYDTSLDLNMR